jgi:hypothetical protein
MTPDAMTQRLKDATTQGQNESIRRRNKLNNAINAARDDLNDSMTMTRRRSDN